MGGAALPRGLFGRDGDVFVPGVITTGPWSDTAMHGGPPTALVGRVVDAWENDDRAWFLGRLTMELIRPVPIAPLRVLIEPRRFGRKLQVLDAALVTADGTEVALARAVRTRWADTGIDEADLVQPGPRPVPPPDECNPVADGRIEEHEPYHRFIDALEMRAVLGEPFDEFGPAVVWMKPLVATFEGESIAPLDRLLQCADFGNGISSVLDFERYSFVNADLTVAVHRWPEGDWILLDATTHARRHGHGHAIGLLSDRDGLVALANQTLVIGPR
jgi:hypothetical protein